MALTVIKTPVTTNDDNHVCRFSHIGNAIYVDLQRQDTEITGVINYSGKMSLIVENKSIFIVGNTAYINVVSNELDFDGIFKILYTATINFGGNDYDVIVIDKTYQALTGVTGFANSNYRQNYKVGIRLTINGTPTTEREFSPNNTGLIRCYLNSILIDYFSNLPEIDYTEEVYKVENSVISFYIQRKEIWRGFEDEWKSLAGVYFATKSVAQLNTDNRAIDKEVYYESANKYSQALFLTAFEEPVFFTGLPFSISALIGTSLYELERVIESETGQDKADILSQNFNNIVNIIIGSDFANEKELTLYIQTKAGLISGNYAENYAINYTN